MPNLCQVRGKIVSPDHVPLVKAAIVFTPLIRQIQPSRDSDSTIVPSSVALTTGSAGEVIAMLAPGAYQVTITASNNGRFASYRISVPDAADADLADIQSLIPPPPVYMDEVRLALAATGENANRAEAAAARAEAAGGGVEYDDTALTARVVALEGMPAIEPYDDTALTARVTTLEDAPTVEPYDDTALTARLDTVENALKDIPAPTPPYDDTALREIIAELTARLDAVEPPVDPPIDPPVPDPVAPAALTAPAISPATGPVGTVYTITEGTYGGTSPITITGKLMQGAADVTASMTGNTFTSTAAGDLVWTETASNGTAPDATQSATASVEAAGEAPIDSVVFIGASLMAAMFGNDYMTSPHGAATTSLKNAGHDIPVYGHARGGTRLNVAAQYYSEARAKYPNALIVMHFGGNDVTADRPYPGGRTTIETGLAALLDVAGDDLRFYPASLSFRDYDDATFQDPSMGSKPYNENIIIPWIAANYPHAMANYGRPKFDNYRRVLQSYDTWLHSDNIHLTSAGYAAFREWLVARVADIFEDVTPAEIPERLYVPPAPQAPVITSQPTISGDTAVGSILAVSPGAASGSPAPSATYQWYVDGVIQNGQTGTSFTRPATVGAVPSVTVTWSNGVDPAAQQSLAALPTTAASTGPVGKKSILNFTISRQPAVNGVNNVTGTTSSLPASFSDIKYADGASSGMSLAISWPANASLGTNPPGYGCGDSGRTNAPAYSGQLLASEITKTFFYVTGDTSMTFVISGAEANKDYELGVVGTRAVTGDRTTNIAVNGVSVSWNAGEDVPTERKLTSKADASGKLTMILTGSGIASGFAYLSGLSIQRTS